MKNLLTWRRTLLALATVGVIGTCSAFSLSGAEDAVVIPPPALDETTQAQSATAVFAGGCFWGVQGVFQHVKGVKNAVSGYAGGAANTAQYERVSNGNTGHAESVEVTFDPSQVSYGTLLQIYFSVAHNPTELNRQGPSIVRRSLPKVPSSSGSHRPTSPSSTPPMPSTSRSSPNLKPSTVSTRRRRNIRIS
jgi:peptide-methionine (S)-S-oxide reductase